MANPYSNCQEMKQEEEENLPTSINTNYFQEPVEFVDQSDPCVVYFIGKRHKALHDHTVFRRRERSLRFVFVVLDSLPRGSSQVHNGHRKGFLLSPCVLLRCVSILRMITSNNQWKTLTLFAKQKSGIKLKSKLNATSLHSSRTVST